MRLLLLAALASSAAAALSGHYEGRVPFILDKIVMNLIFPGDGTMNFDQNVKVNHTEIKCPTEEIAETDSGVTFPNIATTGDCMGDALRKLKKDVTKFTIDINSDGSLTFHSDGWPDLKLTNVDDRYGNPSKGCLPDEDVISVNFEYVKGTSCSTSCNGQDDCPDAPEGVTAQPWCLYIPYKDPHCVLRCSTFSPGCPKGAKCMSDPDAHPVPFRGFCQYPNSTEPVVV